MNSVFIIFKNYNFKDIITILKIISLIGHKVYEISLKGHSYHFFALKKNNFPIFFFLLDKCFSLILVLIS